MLPGIVAGGYQNAVSAPYVAEAVTFDGTNDFLNGTMSPPPSAGKTATFSGWVYFNDLGVTEILFVVSTGENDISTGGLFVQRRGANNTIRVQAHNSAGSTILRWDSNFVVTTTGWTHILVSIDMASSANSLFYVNEINQTSTPATFINDNIAFNDFAQLSNFSSGQRINGDMAEVWFDPNQYIDLSVLANREKFIKTGAAVDLGSDGSTPTGTQPLVYMKGNASVWNAGTNAGSGGNFTMTGSVTDSTNEPVKL